MLLLAPPSRRAHDVAVSLRGPVGDPVAAARIADEAMGSSCPPDKAARLMASILHCGRYDCRVSFLVVRPAILGCLRDALADVGGSILVLDESGDPVPDRTEEAGTIRWSSRRPAMPNRAAGATRSLRPRNPT